METWDAIRARRDVRQFPERPIEADDLAKILEAGRRAPSSSNWQPWDFVVVTDRSQLEDLSKVWQGAGQVARSAATIAMCAHTPSDGTERDRLWFDLGQAAMSIMLEATDLGIGSGHSACQDQDRARSVLGLPEDRFCAFMIPLGYPADRPLRPIERPNRRPFDEVVHWGRF